jgi:hypothetical protein
MPPPPGRFCSIGIQASRQRSDHEAKAEAPRQAEVGFSFHDRSHCGFEEPCGTKTVRYDSRVRDMTTWSVIPW